MDRPPTNRRKASSGRTKAVVVVALVALAGAISFFLRGPDDAAVPPEESQPVDAILAEVPGVDAKIYEGRLSPLMEKADSRRDDLVTEVLHEAAAEQLKALAGLLQKGTAIDAEDLGPLVASEFFSPSLRPEKLTEVYTSSSVIVRRAQSLQPVARATETTESGPPLLAKRLRGLLEPLSGGAELGVHFKVFRIEEQDPGFETTAYYQGHATTGPGTLQQNATWTCTWTSAEDGASPKLLSIVVEDHEEIVPGPMGGAAFADCTEAVLGRTRSFREQLTRSAWYWTDRIQKSFQIDSTGHQGIAIGDVDGDGLEDIYVAQQGGLPNLLYLQNVDGTLRDESVAAGVDWMELTHGVLLVDLDNDGDQDLVLARASHLMLLENDGTGKFERRLRVRNASEYTSVVAADYDADGDLDLYFCGYSPKRKDGEPLGVRGGVPLPYHDANNGGPNLLLRSEGQWKYTDAAREVGLDQNNRRFSFAASWEDYDNDGDPDLYVANDFGRNNLYRNDGGRFTDVAAETGTEDISAGMGVAWGDFNQDGTMDLYVANMFSSAGGRITYQRTFRETASRTTLGDYQRHARGNSLFENLGDGTFADVSVAAAVTMGRWAWGIKFVDLNNDSWEDIYVANGYITSEDSGDL